MTKGIKPPKSDWFTHDPMTTEEADSLLSRYASRNIKAQKTLATDPRLWLVRAYLPCSKHEPREDRKYGKNKLWSFICR